jgi:ribosomal protein S18 acetylase RimI-like enzyme
VAPLGRLDDRAAIRAYLDRDPYRHLLELGDLEEEQWPYTAWYGSGEPELKALALVYTRFPRPILLVLEQHEPELASELLDALLPHLPPEVHAHLSTGLEEVLARRYRITWSAAFLKMELRDREKLAAVNTRAAMGLGPGDLAEVEQLYAESMPSNAFFPEALGLLPYFGVRAGGRLVSIAGLHVYSPRYGAASVGNVTTHPEHRGRGYAGAAVGALCQHIAPEVAHIGLNVRADNAAAVRCYERVGFVEGSGYGEYVGGRVRAREGGGQVHAGRRETNP